MTDRLQELAEIIDRQGCAIEEMVYGMRNGTRISRDKQERLRERIEVLSHSLDEYSALTAPDDEDEEE